MSVKGSDDILLAELDKLIGQAEQAPKAGYIGYQQFITKCLASINRISGLDSVYGQQANQIAKHAFVLGDPNHTHLDMLGTIKALREDVADGYLTTLQERIHEDMFSDYLEMAEYLLAENYLGSKDAAAVLAGGTLEEHIRQLCTKNNIPIEKSVETMNTKLRAAGVYGLNEQKQVTAWYGLRNSAAHAQYKDYEKDDVVQFVQGLRHFISKYPA